MQILNIGSINIDYVYQTPHFVVGGETLEATHRTVFMGGKGLNQTVAIARSGLKVSHAGVLGVDGQFLYDFLHSMNVNIDHLRIDQKAASGHTFIQVTPDAENAILYYPGTNHSLDTQLIDSALSTLKTGDIVLIQNEVNGVGEILSKAKAKGLITVFNPAPFDASVCQYPLDCVDVIILNQTEAQGMLSQSIQDPTIAVNELGKRLPKAIIIMTLGSKGVIYALPNTEPKILHAYQMKAVDTTGAGDTFVGYAMHAIINWFTERDCEKFHHYIDSAVLAAGLSVTKRGAVDSIPTIEQVKIAQAKMFK